MEISNYIKKKVLNFFIYLPGLPATLKPMQGENTPILTLAERKRGGVITL